MATTMLTHTKTVLGFDNYIRKANVTAVTLNNAAVAGGSSLEHLLIEDPSFRLETNAPTADPEIIFQFAVAPTQRPLVGLVNHNISQNHTRLIVAQSTLLAGPYTDVGEVNLTGDTVVLLSRMNYDVLWELPTTPTQAFLRFRFDGSNPWAPLSIGQIVLMQKYETTRNPHWEGVTARFERPMVKQRAMGGALHVARGNVRTDFSTRLEFSRIGDSQMAQLYWIYETYGQRLVAVIPPGMAGQVNPLGMPHLYGRIDAIDDLSVPGLAAGAHLHDISLQFSGSY